MIAKLRKNLSLRLFVCGFCLIFSPPLLADECAEWFSNLKIAPAAKDCKFKCKTSGVDMSNFYCHEQCDRLCNLAKSVCVTSSFWNSIMGGNPKPFRLPNEGERRSLDRALSRLPSALSPKALKAIGLSAARDWISPSNPASSSNEGVVEDDGRDSPEEDFANNVEFYLFDQKKLLQASPDIFRWMNKNLDQSIKLKKGCDDIKK